MNASNDNDLWTLIAHMKDKSFSVPNGPTAKGNDDAKSYNLGKIAHVDPAVLAQKKFKTWGAINTASMHIGQEALSTGIYRKNQELDFIGCPYKEWALSGKEGEEAEAMPLPKKSTG